jgi:hypothetical protein
MSRKPKEINKPTRKTAELGLNAGNDGSYSAELSGFHSRSGLRVVEGRRDILRRTGLSPRLIPGPLM